MVWRVTRDVRAVVIAVLMMEASLYYGLLMTKISPDLPQVLFVGAMVWALVGLPRAVTGAGGSRPACSQGSPLSKFTRDLAAAGGAGVHAGAGLALALAPQSLSVAGGVIALLLFQPVVIWKSQHDWASFRFQAVRATGNMHGRCAHSANLSACNSASSALCCCRWC